MCEPDVSLILESEWTTSLSSIVQVAMPVKEDMSLFATFEILCNERTALPQNAN